MKMTTNELADRLMESNSVSWGSCTHEQHDNDKYFKEQAATMLRQQQAEIEALKEARCVACGWNPNLIGSEK
jgi:hypothetical protein